MAESKTGIENVSPGRALTEMAMGYTRSRMLCAAARLGLADAMGNDPCSVEELAAKCGAQPGSLYRLLRALASFGVVAEKSPRHFILTPLGKPLRKDAPNSEWAAVVFWGDLLADNWSHLTECVRSGESAMQISKREGTALRWSKDPNAGAIFGAVMGTAPAENYAPIARAWDFSKHHTVADLGGGGGALMAAVLNTYPNVRGMLVDRPEYVDKAALRFENEGLAARCQAIGADLSQGVPAGADVYVLKHVLHGCDDTAAIRILGHCRDALPAEGRLLVIEFVLPDVVDHADPKLEQRLASDLNMLTATGGRERSAIEWKSLLGEAGFECRRIIPVPGDLVSIVEAAGPV
jgi:O-methyltransferase domain/Dimerisation domain